MWYCFFLSTESSSVLLLSVDCSLFTVCLLVFFLPDSARAGEGPFLACFVYLLIDSIIEGADDVNRVLRVSPVGCN